MSLKNKDMIAALESLKTNQGWLAIVNVLNLNIEHVEEKLHGEVEMDESDTVIADKYSLGFLWEYLKLKRKDRKLLRDLPDTLITALREAGDSPLPENLRGLDPYE